MNMKSKKIIASILASMILISGCSAKTDIQSEPAVTSSSVTTIEPIKFDETSETTAEKAKFEFNPHVYSAQLGKSVSKEKWDALYNLCDALRAGVKVKKHTSGQWMIQCFAVFSRLQA